MPNSLITAIAQNTKTFSGSRIYFFKLLGSKEKVLELENARIEIVLPYYIQYLESKDINMLEAMNYYTFSFSGEGFYDLLVITIVGCFRKLENNDLNFIPY
jgi:hypothetical protein